MFVSPDKRLTFGAQQRFTKTLAQFPGELHSLLGRHRNMIGVVDRLPKKLWENMRPHQRAVGMTELAVHEVTSVQRISAQRLRPATPSVRNEFTSERVEVRCSRELGAGHLPDVSRVVWQRAAASNQMGSAVLRSWNVAERRRGRWGLARPLRRWCARQGSHQCHDSRNAVGARQ